MSIEDRVMDVLLTASFADADARLAREEKLRSLIGERDRALTNEYIAKPNRDEMIPQFKHLLARAEAAEARAAEYEKALHEIDKLAYSHVKGGIGKAQQIARAALAKEKNDEN